MSEPTTELKECHITETVYKFYHVYAASEDDAWTVFQKNPDTYYTGEEPDRACEVKCSKDIDLLNA